MDSYMLEGLGADSKFLNTVNDILGVGQSAAQVYSTVKTTGATPGIVPSVQYSPALISSGAAQPKPGMSTTTKVVIVGGIVLVAGGIVYAVTRKKKKS